MSWKENLHWRYASKKFDPTKKLTEAQLTALLEAANLAPTSLGLQPFKIVSISNDAVKQKLLPFTFNQTQIVDASHVLVFANLKQVKEADIDALMQRSVRARGGDLADREGYKKMALGYSSQLSDEEVNTWTAKQAYIALGTLMTVAAELKIDACPMEGFQPIEYDRALGLTETSYTSAVVLPVGFRSEEDVLQDLPKVRKTLAELVDRID